MKMLPSNTERWMTPEQLKERYGFTTGNQAKMRMNRKIPFSKMGKYIRYDELEIIKWMESCAIGVENETN